MIRIRQHPHITCAKKVHILTLPTSIYATVILWKYPLTLLTEAPAYISRKSKIYKNNIFRYYWELTNQSLLFKEGYYTSFQAKKYMAIKNHLNICLLCHREKRFPKTISLNSWYNWNICWYFSNFFCLL